MSSLQFHLFNHKRAEVTLNGGGKKRNKFVNPMKTVSSSLKVLRCGTFLILKGHFTTNKAKYCLISVCYQLRTPKFYAWEIKLLDVF